VLPGCAGTSMISPKSKHHAPITGTRSVGDFLNITLNPVAHTIAYPTNPMAIRHRSVHRKFLRNHTLADPAGNLIAAYEVPNYALLIQAAKKGPTQHSPH